MAQMVANDLSVSLAGYWWTRLKNPVFIEFLAQTHIGDIFRLSSDRL